MRDVKRGSAKLSAAHFSHFANKPIIGSKVSEAPAVANATPIVAAIASPTLQDRPDDEIWPQVAGHGVPEVKVDDSLSKPSSIKLLGSGIPRTLKLTVQAENSGSLYVGYQINGKAIEGWHEFVSGENTISVELPAEIDGNFIWIVRDLKRGAAKLSALHAIQNTNKGQTAASTSAAAAQVLAQDDAKNPPAATDELWPRVDAHPAPEVKADDSLTAASSIKLAGADGPRTVKLILQAENPGSLYVGYQVGGKAIEDWREFVTGQNVISVDLPTVIDGNFIWIRRDAQRGVASLKAVRVKH